MEETPEPVSFVLFDKNERTYFNGTDWDEDRLSAMHFVNTESAEAASNTVYPERCIKIVAEGVELSDPMHLGAVLLEVARHRDEQDQQWGGPKHDDDHNAWDWVIYITRHMGKAIIYPGETKAALEIMRLELVKVAALAVSAIQSIDRKLERYTANG